jgi:hypothetical protein
MELLGRKGQAENTVVATMLLLVVVGFLGVIMVTVYDSVESSLTGSIASTTSDAYYTSQNFTENYYDGMDLASNIPIVLAAGLLIAVIVGFALYVRG